jgi:hypothetical protein
MKRMLLMFSLIAFVSTAFAASDIGTSPIMLSVQLMDGSKERTDWSAATLDGKPALISVVSGGQGKVHDSFSMTLTPRISKNGKIKVRFVASIKPTKGMNSIDISQEVVLDNGNEATIILEPAIQSGESDKSAHSGYTLKLSATKG